MIVVTLVSFAMSLYGLARRSRRPCNVACDSFVPITAGNIILMCFTLGAALNNIFFSSGVLSTAHRNECVTL